MGETLNALEIVVNLIYLAGQHTEDPQALDYLKRAENRVVELAKTLQTQAHDPPSEDFRHAPN